MFKKVWILIRSVSVDLSLLFAGRSPEQGGFGEGFLSDKVRDIIRLYCIGQNVKSKCPVGTIYYMVILFARLCSPREGKCFP